MDTFPDASGPLPDPEAQLERMVLGIALLRPELMDILIKQARPEFFAYPSHQLIFEKINELYAQGLDITIDILADHLQQDNTLDDIGGIAYLYSLAEHPPVVDYQQYLNRLRDRYLRRELRNLLEQYLHRTDDPTLTPPTLIENLTAELTHLHTETSDRGLQPIKDELSSLWEYLDSLYTEGVEITGIPTEFAELDRLTSGLQPGDLVIIAGRPSMGKTAFALNIALNIARRHQSVAFFSLEMSAQQLLQRILAISTQIELGKIRRAQLAPEEWEKISVTVSQLASLPLFIDDTAGLSVHEIRANCRELQRSHPLSAVFVDYLQLLRAGGRYENRQQEVTAISRNLKELAKELHVPVIALSQLSRNPDRREDSRPQLSDLRESGSIEQDADVVIFIYRDEFYNPETKFRNIAEIIIAKQRNGPTDTVYLHFQRDYQRFVNIDPHYRSILTPE